jgi:peptidase E
MDRKVNMLFSQYNFNELWARDIISKYIKATDRLVVIPFSFGDHFTHNLWNNAYNKEGKYYLDIIKPFLDYGILEEQISWINYFEDTMDTANLKIKKSDILFFTGGFPDKMMDRLSEFNLVNEIENYKGLIIGSSAGAMIQIANYHITPDDDYLSFSYQRGLNLIVDFDIEVHYERTNLQDEFISKVLKEKVDTIYAITDHGGIIVENDEVTLLGDVCIFCI